MRLTQIQGDSRGYWALLGFAAMMIIAGFAAGMYMEHHGHYVTGMNNQIVWGMPHVFAVYLIIAASGALNVASIASVFGRAVYKPLAPLSALLSIALLVGGLAVLVLDLGRPDRLIIAMTYLNPKSIFAWNQILYTGFIVITLVYIWCMLERRMQTHTRAVGILAFVWRFALTTGTGLIFGFLVARQAYDAAVLAPLFIVMSLAAGMAVYILALIVTYAATGRALGAAILRRLSNLLSIFVCAVLYFVLVYHLANLYATEHHAIEAFILFGENGGGVYAMVFWGLQILLGGVVPLALLWTPLIKRRAILALACALVIIGGLAQMFVIIIGGQAYPLDIFPGMEVIASGFMDGAVATYSPSLPELLLGAGAGFGIALFIVAVGINILGLLPESLADEAIEPRAADVAA